MKILGGQYYINDDLYEGNIDISYWWEYKDYLEPQLIGAVLTGEEEKHFRSIGYSEIYAENFKYYDPVLKNNT